MFEHLPFIGKLFESTAEIVKESVTDVDASNRIIESLDTLQQEVNGRLYEAELNTKTVPWVDALHKMGRQLTNYLLIVVVTILLLCEVEITGPVALLMGGGNVAYQFIKGRGK